MAKPEDLAKYPRRRGAGRTYAAMVDSLDQAIARVLAALDAKGIAGSTLVLFASDNGAGGGPAINDLLAGTVQVMLIQAGGAIGQNVRSGRLTGLATSGRQRSPHFPDLPTIAEFYPGFETTSWVGLIAPAGTPRPAIDKLNGTLAAILATSDMKEKFGAQAAEIVASTPEQFGELIKSESAKWGRIIREKNIRVD
jgi:tripartite-type tricarboxylate transporter receptor subunit TctC